MALDAADVDPAFIAVGRRGADQRHPSVAAQCVRRQRCAPAKSCAPAGGKVVFDIDYRPVLWGLTGKDAGENRFVAHDAVTARLQQVLPLCDLIVGTEEEIHILGGTTDTIAALARDPRTDRRAAGLQARRAGLFGVSRGHSRPPRRGRGRARLSRSRCSTCSAPATPSWPASCAAGCAASRWRRCCEIRQRLRRDRGLAPRLRAGDADLGGAAAVPRGSATARSACATTRRWSTSTGPTTRVGAL